MKEVNTYRTIFQTFEQGIYRDFTNPYSPEQNGVSERKNRTLIEVVLSMLHHANFSSTYWGEAVLTANYLQNRLPTKAVYNKTPYELWTGRKPNLIHLQTFGCTAYALIPEERRKKSALSEKSTPCWFLGYPSGIKGYRLQAKSNRSIIISRNVIFRENDFKISKSKENHSDSDHDDLSLLADLLKPYTVPLQTPMIHPIQILPIQNPLPLPLQPQVQVQAPNPLDIPNTPSQNEPSPSTPITISSDSQSSGEQHTPQSLLKLYENYGLDPSPQSSAPSTPTIDNSSPRSNTSPSSSIPIRPKRSRKSPERLIETIEGRPPKSKSKKKPWIFTVSDSFSQDFIVESDPLSYEEALSSPQSKEWQDAINSEFQSLLKNDTWELTILPPQRTTVGCKWIFKTKYGPNNTIIKRKARLVAQGFSQQPGIDYHETFSPVLKSSSLRVLLAYATHYGLHIHQMDVCTAFLNGHLQEEVYMTLPKGLNTRDKHLVCKLKKSLYGLKQSSRAWYERLDSYLVSLGFTKSEADANIYIYKGDTQFIILAIFVDDTLLITNDEIILLGKTKQSLHSEFDMTDLGPVLNSTILGLQVIYDQNARILRILQTRYIEFLLKKFLMETCNPASTPMEPGLKLSKVDCPQTNDELTDMKNVPYKPLVGSLMHVSVSTPPDISYPTNTVAQFLSNPGRKHWSSAKRILDILKAQNL